ncbi:oligosaccharide repeat unit polymerase [Megamonas funiformis]|uniref:oligosaccharide repeat unit polymerase n=1 Tax=Megamonas funiformis TaxID=437897 RepID=UPI00351F87D0
MISFDQIQLFNGLLYMDRVLFLLSAIIVLHFFLEWYFFIKKRKFIFDYWHYTCFFIIILPVCIMYPFAGSVINIISVGVAIYDIQDYVNMAYIISIIGYFCMLIGKSICGNKVRRNYNFLERELYKNFNSERYYNVINTINIIILIVLIVLCLRYPEYVFNFRLIRYSEPILGPVINAIVSFSTYSLLFLFFRAIKEKNKVSIFFLLLNIAIILLIGTRALIVQPILIIILIYLGLNRDSLKIVLKISIYVVLLIILNIIFDNFRKYLLGYDNIGLGFFIQFFYGNNMSDLRDFAWILTGFNDDFLWGKTYLSAILSFIPSSLLVFRETYSLGKVTNNFVGIEGEHLGLRGTIFAEPYLNFDIWGVAIVGIILGYWLQYTNNNFLKSMEMKKDIYEIYANLFMYKLFAGLLVQSGGFFISYIGIFMVLLGSFIRRIK